MQTVTECYKVFFETDCVAYRMPSQGRTSVSKVTIKQVWQIFIRSPGKSTSMLTLELNIRRPTVWKVLHKQLAFKPYKLVLI